MSERAERLSDHQIDQARNVDIVALVMRHVKLTRKGDEYWACCPFHKEDRASFKVENGRRAYKCFGCGAGGDAIKWVMETEGLSFIDAVKKLTDAPHIAPMHSFKQPTWVSKPINQRDGYKDALAIWDEARPAKGTPVDAYLRARGIRLPVSDELRYAPNLFHGPSRKRFPAMVARISEASGFCAVQRTYLDPTLPQKAPVPREEQKRGKGAMYAGCVRLREPGDVLGIAEGIETALSATQLYQISTWAVLNVNRLSRIQIPRHVHSLVIFADPGEAGKREAFAAAETYERRGLPTEIVFPQADFKAPAKADFNDVARDGTARI